MWEIPIYSIVNQSKESIVIKFWTVTSVRPSSTPAKWCFPVGWSSSSHERPYPFYLVRSVSNLMDWTIWFSRLARKITMLCRTRFLPLGIRERCNVSDLCGARNTAQIKNKYSNKNRLSGNSQHPFDKSPKLIACCHLQIWWPCKTPMSLILNYFRWAPAQSQLGGHTSLDLVYIKINWMWLVRFSPLVVISPLNPVLLPLEVESTFTSSK